MEARATAKYLPISPQKLRLVCDQVRGMGALDALDVLYFMPQKGAVYVSKALNSALANAENNFGLEPEDMFVSEIFANEGPRRRWRRFGARGRFKPIVKRYAHLTVVIAERDIVEEDDDDEELEAVAETAAVEEAIVAEVEEDDDLMSDEDLEDSEEEEVEAEEADDEPEAEPESDESDNDEDNKDEDKE
ncbi:MAG: 50S ribosomal protein L22 [Chloroflexi bacterium]|nr:50S ribosomal protein L22 [Chloroflexota bacterium]